MLVAVIRTIVLYLAVIAALRVMGKRQIGELEPSELVVAIMISELAAVPMQEAGLPLASGLVPMIVLIALEVFMSGALLKSIRLRRLVCGVPSILIENGKILQHELKKNRLTVDELIEDLRLQNVLDISTVQYAILETNGKLSAVLYNEFRPMSSGAQGGADRGLPVAVVSDGRTLGANLKKLGLSPGWVDETVRARGAAGVSEVFLLMVDEQGGIYYLPKEGRHA